MCFGTQSFTVLQCLICEGDLKCRFGDSIAVRVAIGGCLALSGSFLSELAIGACAQQNHYTWFYAVGGNGPCKSWEDHEQCMDHWTNHPQEDPLIDCDTDTPNDWVSYQKIDCIWGCWNNLTRQDATLVNAMANPLNTGTADFCMCAPEPGDGGGMGI